MFSQKQVTVGNGPAYLFDYRIDKRRLLTVFTLQEVTASEMGSGLWT